MTTTCTNLFGFFITELLKVNETVFFITVSINEVKIKKYENIIIHNCKNKEECVIITIIINNK